MESVVLYKARSNFIKYCLLIIVIIAFGYILSNVNFTYSNPLYINHIYNDKYNYPSFGDNKDKEIIKYISSVNDYDKINYRINIVNGYINILFLKYSTNDIQYDSLLFINNELTNLITYYNTSEDNLIYNIKEELYSKYKESYNDLKLNDISYELNDNGINIYIDNKTIYIDNENIVKEHKEPKIIPDKYISFTFDDGPSIYTKDIMDILDKYDFKATFFEVGNMIRKYPEVTKEVINRGYEVGNHTTDHSNLNRLSESGIASKINDNNNLFYETTGKYMELVRCPYGNSNKKVRSVIDKPIIYWSVDSRDWESRNTNKIVELVKNNTKDGDIVLFHDLYSTTKDAITILAEYYYLNGYKIVSVSELYKIKEKELIPHQIHYNAR